MAGRPLIRLMCRPAGLLPATCGGYDTTAQARPQWPFSAPSGATPILRESGS